MNQQIPCNMTTVAAVDYLAARLSFWKITAAVTAWLAFFFAVLFFIALGNY